MNVDETIFRAFSQWRGRSRVLDRLAVFGARQLVLVMAVGALLVFWFAAPVSIRLALLGDVLLSLFIAWPLAVLFEFIFARRRPYLAQNKKPLEDFWTPTPSFPSTHATIAFAIATPVFLFYPILGLLFYFFALLVSLSRVYVGVHYVSDVMAGAILGTGVSWLIASL